MLRCFFVTLCRASAQDSDSKQMSLFQLVDALVVPADRLGKPIPIEAHFYFKLDDGDLNRDFEFRALWKASTGAEYPGEKINAVAATFAQIRIRALQIRVPPETGNYEFTFEWRESGTDDWVRSDRYWPCIVATAPDAEPQDDEPRAPVGPGA